MVDPFSAVQAANGAADIDEVAVVGRRGRSRHKSSLEHEATMLAALLDMQKVEPLLAAHLPIVSELGHSEFRYERNVVLQPIPNRTHHPWQ